MFAATGGVGRVADALGSTLAGFVQDLTSTPSPSELPPELAGAPVIEQPDEPYTNQATIDLVGTIPENAAGVGANRIRIYVAIGEQDPGIVTEIPVGRTVRFVVPGVNLVEGSNAFSATIVSSAGESVASPVVTYIFDATNPRIVINSPANGAVVNARSASIEGETQPRSEVRIWNATTNLTVSGAADENGRFAISLPIDVGQNDIGVTIIDPAGNVGHLVMAVRKGNGKLTAVLTPSAYSIKISKLPERIQLTVAVTDPDGRPLEAAKVTFALAVPGVPAVTSNTLETAGDGMASWTTTIPKGATIGQISATVIVQTTGFGETTDRTVISLER
jgi:hypothetical protein